MGNTTARKKNCNEFWSRILVLKKNPEQGKSSSEMDAGSWFSWGAVETVISCTVKQ